MQIFEPIFAALDRGGVRYVTVGGVAVVLHGHVRLTADLDIAIDLSLAEATKAVRVLSELGLSPTIPVDPMTFADSTIRQAWVHDKGMQVFQMRDVNSPLRSVDIFVDSPIEFEDLWSRSEVKIIGKTPARVASIPDIISLKQKSDRPKDRSDIEILEKIMKMREAEDAPGN